MTAEQFKRIKWYRHNWHSIAEENTIIGLSKFKEANGTILYKINGRPRLYDSVKDFEELLYDMSVLESWLIGCSIKELNSLPVINHETAHALKNLTTKQK